MLLDVAGQKPLGKVEEGVFTDLPFIQNSIPFLSIAEKASVWVVQVTRKRVLFIDDVKRKPDYLLIFCIAKTLDEVTELGLDCIGEALNVLLGILRRVEHVDSVWHLHVDRLEQFQVRIRSFFRTLCFLFDLGHFQVQVRSFFWALCFLFGTLRLRLCLCGRLGELGRAFEEE